MKRSHYLIFILFIMLSQSCKRGGMTENDDINRIDTAVIVPGLKSILKEYVRKYPQFQKLSIDGDVLLKDKYKDRNESNIYLLGPT